MTSKDYHKIITAIYRQYNPDKVSEVSGLLDKYKGQEEALLQSIYTKYKVSLNDKVMFEQEEKTNLTNSEAFDNVYSNAMSGTNRKLNKKYYCIGGVALFFLIAISVWWYNTRENEITANTENLEKVKSEQITQTNSGKVQEYKALSLSDLETLRVNPKNNSSITAKGYVLKKPNKEKVIYVGHLSDSIVVTINYSEQYNKIEWSSGINREWLYNHLSKKIKNNYEYSSMFSNNDETDNKMEGLPYIEDEGYIDGNKIYGTYRLMHKGKIIGYGITIREGF